MALVSNKLRTFLSLLGITIGIFAIIAVYAIVDSLERNIRQSVESLGSDVVYIQKWPWGGDGGEFAWWKYFQRPEVGMNDFKRLAARSPRTADYLTYIAGSSETLKKWEFVGGERGGQWHHLPLRFVEFAQHGIRTLLLRRGNGLRQERCDSRV